MSFIRILAASLLLTGCSVLIEEPKGVIVHCKVDDQTLCPSFNVVNGVVNLFANCVGDFDRTHTLNVFWYNKAFGRYVDPATGKVKTMLAYTESPEEVHVSSAPLLIHELEHVRLWRNVGDPDDTHEVPPGLWTMETNIMIQKITTAYRAGKTTCE